MNDLKDQYQPTSQSTIPSLSGEQQNAINTGAQAAQTKREEVTIDMINFKGSDELYKPDVQHNVEGNAKVVGGHMQNQVDVNITPTLDSERKVEEQVQEKIDRTPPASAKPATYGSYPNYSPKSNKDV